MLYYFKASITDESFIAIDISPSTFNCPCIKALVPSNSPDDIFSNVSKGSNSKHKTCCKNLYFDGGAISN